MVENHKYSIDINVIIYSAAHGGNERLFFFYWYYIYVQGLFLITYNLYAQLLMLLFQDKAITYVLYFVPVIVSEMIKNLIALYKADLGPRTRSHNYTIVLYTIPKRLLESQVICAEKEVF